MLDEMIVSQYNQGRNAIVQRRDGEKWYYDVCRLMVCEQSWGSGKIKFEWRSVYMGQKTPTEAKQIMVLLGMIEKDAKEDFFDDWVNVDQLNRDLRGVDID